MRPWVAARTQGKLLNMIGGGAAGGGATGGGAAGGAGPAAAADAVKVGCCHLKPMLKSPGFTGSALEAKT